MVGRKIYYELATGDVVLEIPEKHNIKSVNTTKEQDFAMYPILESINPETIGLIQLNYGQYQSEFLSAKSVKIDLETGGLLFEYPYFSPPLITQVESLRIENEQLRIKVQEQKQQLDCLNIAMANILGV